MASLLCYIRVAVIVTLGKISECTKNQKALGKSVIGGEYTTIDKFPHAVYLTVICSNEAPYYICGASVVNQMLVITAAHCLSMCDPDETTVICTVGHENINKATNHDVINFKLHERFIQETLINDIALATVDTLPLGDKIKRIVIPHQYPQNVKNKIASVAGWGQHGDETTDFKLLKSVNRVMRDFETCVKILGEELQIGAFCAGEIGNPTSRTAIGDSGSGLIYKSRILLGILSYDVDAHPGLEVFTNVTYFYPWIEETADTLYCESFNISEVTLPSSELGSS